MSDITESIKLLSYPAKSIGEILIEFYQTMKSLENDEYRAGKQAVKIVMTINDIEDLIKKQTNGRE